jgi:hypothetical protein
MPRRKEVVLTDEQIREQVLAAVSKHGSQRKTAATFDIAQPYLSRYLAGRELAGPAILKLIGLQRVTDRYVKL